MKLVNFLKKLRNEQVTVELKNGTTIWGTLQTVSPQMNVTLTDVALTLPNNNHSNSPSALASMYLTGKGPSNEGATSGDKITTSLQYINVRGNTIRQIILPDSLNLDSLLIDETQLNRLRRQGKVVSDANKKRRRDFDGQQTKRIRRGV
ncbi:hypothetical protein KAFR_0G01530 [Kazachstania africana CBS 2517]|uniref:Sm domain-containing protein n=1 Tax=Kazachstania africana (strain ATCC 22294 / BCRC 22015 / CBS 2517 / CECT 1963 / NBRC 1671 / NRRL Y-8276) TaxID=1071382 RepID=H2AXT7_KAZAF|nr:hypothetical protein KAFR_0G01530 [Kazachstania africana CBS 2517]CCF59187.1 hypothetical protein KAFR_0G01530 [Kazachstania africana CBS 2517]